jgi:hypothetical protein
MAICAFCKTEETMLYESGIPICLTCVDRRESKSRKKDATAKVHATLVRRLAELKMAADSATMEFNAISGDIPSGLPDPDGTQRIQNAARTLKAARDEMMMAHNRLNAFLETGIVPDDLKQSD